MSLSYSQLLQLHKTHPGWRLLRADNGPLILSFLDRVFIEQNVRVISQSNLISKLEDTLYVLRQSEGASSYSKSASSYLDDWAHNDKGWLRKFYPSGSDEPHFDLTPATEKVLSWVESLSGRTFIGTESRLLTLFELLRQMVLGAETDKETRIEALEKQKKTIDAEIKAIRNGTIAVLDETALRERFMQFSSMARELLSDFRSVEQNFRNLDMEVREKIATWDGRKGELLEQIFGDRDIIIDSDQGKSFRAFWDFLMSSSSQEEFSELLEKIFAMNAIQGQHPDIRLKRIHFDWLEAGEHTQRTVAGLSQQLRRYLDNQAYLENKRIMQILDTIAQKALHAKDNLPRGDFMTINNFSPDIILPMERPLHTPTRTPVLDSIITDADDGHIDAGALYTQQFVDKAPLLEIIRKELQTSSQVTLSALLEKYPLRKGLAELVTYLSIAGEDRATIFDDTMQEQVEWTDMDMTLRRATIPRIIFNRT